MATTARKYKANISTFIRSKHELYNISRTCQLVDVNFAIGIIHKARTPGRGSGGPVISVLVRMKNKGSAISVCTQYFFAGSIQIEIKKVSFSDRQNYLFPSPFYY